MTVKRVRMSTCASDGPTGFGLGETAEQAVQTHPNDDEERLEQMVHPKNQGDVDAPRKVEWTCLGLHAFGYGEWTCWGLYGMAMERSCSLWRRREFWDHSVPPNKTRSTRLSLCGCDRTTSISSLRASYGNITRAHKQKTLPRQPSKKYSTEADVSHNRHVLEDSSGDGSRRPGEWMLSPKKVTKEANQQDVSW